MPKVTLCKNEKDEAIKIVISKYLIVRDLKKQDLIKRTGMHPTTFYSRLKAPSNFTVAELRSIYDALKVPADERGGV